MSVKDVTKYALGYNIKKEQFYLYYRLEGDTKLYEIRPSPDQFIGLSEMFRNEKPIRFNDEELFFVTGEEEVGEGETPIPVKPG